MALHSARSKTGRRLYVRAAVLAFVLGTTAWILVEYWLAGINVDYNAGAAPAAVAVVPTPPAKSARPPAHDLPAPVGAVGRRYQARVTWATRPHEFPADGIRGVAVRNAEGGQEHAVGFRYHEDRIEAESGLPDGKYTWKAGDRLAFPVTHATFLEVVAGVASLRDVASGQPAESVVVFYLVPVQVRTSSGQRHELSVKLTCEGATADPVRAAYSKTFETQDGQTLAMLVPRGPLRFVARQAYSDLPLEFDTGVTSSIGDRSPEEGELIELSISGWQELTVRLIEQAPGALWTHFERLGVEGNAPVAVALSNWGGNVQPLRLQGKWLVAPSATNAQALIAVAVPPLARDCSITAAVSIGGSAQMAVAGGSPVARGKADLRPGAGPYSLDAIVFSTDWSISVLVRDTAENPVPDYVVAVRLVDFSRAEPVWFGAEARQRTNEQGRALFPGIRSGASILARLSFETRPPRELNPDLKTDYSYDPSNPVTEVVVVLPATIGRPLAIEFDTSSLSQGWTPQQLASGAIRATAVPYLVIARSSNRKLDCDASASVKIDQRSRLVTNVRSPGAYDILSMTRAGEVWAVGHAHTAESPPARVTVAEGIQLRVSLKNDTGEPLHGALICTSAPSAEIVWALAQAHRKDYVRFFSRQTTSLSGTCTFPCQPANADPSGWLIYHEDFGVFRPGNVAGNVREGFQISAGSRVASGTLSVRASDQVLAGKKLLLCVSPVFTEAGGAMTELFAFLGATVEVVDGSARIDRLPSGRYAIAIVELVDNEYRPLGDQWSRIVDVADGQSALIRFPAK